MVSPAEKQYIVAEAALKTFAVAALRAVGVSEEPARGIIDNLVQADMRGVESHGIVRLPIYVDRLAARGSNADPHIKVVHETPSSLVIDGDNGMGQLVGMRAMELTIEKAKKGGMCVFTSVRNSNHYGACAYYAEMACAEDMIGVTFTMGGINHMVPWGGAQAMLGNNPFAIAMPAGEELPVILDMACSVAARGKIIVAAKEGRPIPADWAVGPDGQATTDAVEALKGFVQPIGGPKGYALTLMVGLLSSMLSGAAFGSEVTHMYEDLENPQNVGHLFGVLPINLFEEVQTYKDRMDKAIREMRGAQRAPGVERIYLPGEREHLLLAERRRNGIPIGEGVFEDLNEMGARFGLRLESDRN